MSNSKATEYPDDAVSSSTKSVQSVQCDVKIDGSKPMWGQVGNLGDYYWEWVHIAEPGSSRFFESDFFEMFSKTPWWMVPLIYIPMVAIVLWDAYVTKKSTSSDLAAGILIGSVLWQVHEYTFHRFIFHKEVSAPLWISLHYVLHGSHHKHPMDKSRCVFAPILSLLIAGFWFWAFDKIFPQSLSRGVWAGLALGYMAYDLIHYMVHTNYELPGTFLKMLKSRHNMHHYKCSEHAYGVSSEILDLIFGT